MGEILSLKTYCHFCGKAQEDAPILITSGGSCICDECVFICVKIINKNRPDLVCNPVSFMLEEIGG